MSKGPDLHAVIDGKTVDRAAIRAWEARRQAAVMRKLGMADRGGSFEARRKALLDRKLALGHEKLRDWLARDLRWSVAISRIAVRLSGARRRTSVCEIVVPQGSADGFAHWFNERTRLSDEPPMLDACPDHFIIATDEKGRQVVAETTGGSPFATEFLVDYADVSGLATPANPGYPLQVAGVARLADGLAIGGVRHQFRQEGEGFRALLTVEFPWAVMGPMISQHRWHLATEFSNWIEMAG